MNNACLHFRFSAGGANGMQSLGNLLNVPSFPTKNIDAFFLFFSFFVGRLIIIIITKYSGYSKCVLAVALLSK